MREKGVPPKRGIMPRRSARIFVLLLAVLGALALPFPSPEAMGLLRIGGGIGFVDEERAPVGRMIWDALPLWFIALSLDVEYWSLADRHELMPFATLSTTFIGQVTVGAAPVLAISREDLPRLDLRWALKAGLGTSLGPLGVFVESLYVTGSALEFAPDLSRGKLRFVVGATLGF